MSAWSITQSQWALDVISGHHRSCLCDLQKSQFPGGSVSRWRSVARRRRVRANFQGNRLVLEHCFDYDVASCFRVDGVLGNQVTAFRDDQVGILYYLELLETVLLIQPHALTYDVKDIDNAERPVALVRAEFAMIGMIDGDQRINTCITSSPKLVQLQLAFEGGEH